MPQIDCEKYIEVNSEIRFGKPVIKGTRIAVSDITSLLASGLTHQQIINDFPQLNEIEILACIAWNN